MTWQPNSGSIVPMPSNFPTKKPPRQTWLGLIAETLFYINVLGCFTDVTIAGLTGQVGLLWAAACFMCGAICFHIADRMEQK